MNPMFSVLKMLALLAGMFLPEVLAGELKSPRNISGIYPHLAFFNNENECGTGAVVPWADRLWVVTYGPHLPKGSSDKLYEIDRNLNLVVRPESIGGTPANRMIHQESEQLFIGPYAVDSARRVRSIPYTTMFGRHTGTARHLVDPTNWVYYATMEEGLYEVNVHSLEVRRLWTDEQQQGGRHSGLPGYHGKGFFSGQGRMVYSNNGEHGAAALVNPSIPSGVLAEWDGISDQWRIIRRNQFTEVTGYQGLTGNAGNEGGPIWSVGWDHRSLILMVLDGGKWFSYRLPKASHCYDGAHGWNTEWPRIRDVGTPGRPDLLMTMHGMFWGFPENFSATRSAGIRPRSTYLKVIGDFCRWNDRVVFGCDDTARSEFLNKRRTKGNLEGPGQSQSNLWFVDPETPDQLGAPLGRGGVWVQDSLQAGEISEPFLFSGFDRRGLQLTHDSGHPVTFRLETDRLGNGRWETLRECTVQPGALEWIEFGNRERGAWIRLQCQQEAKSVTAFFQYSNRDRRRDRPDARFSGIAQLDSRHVQGGIVRARGENKRTLALAAATSSNGVYRTTGFYELDGDLKLRRVTDPAAEEYTRSRAAIPAGVVTIDSASVLVVDDLGRRWRLPKGDPAFDRPGALGPERVDREICTERDVFNVHGTFYELPAENAGGFSRIRPIATHNFRIQDFCSYRGMMVLTGLKAGAATSGHVIGSDDGLASVWLGTVDDLWFLGKVRGRGGPWERTRVRAGETSDPYLLAGYDQKTLRLTNHGKADVEMELQVDLTGSGCWKTYRLFTVKPGKPLEHRFSDAFSAYWIRFVSRSDAVVSTSLDYR